jgi:hypothetical protein
LCKEACKPYDAFDHLRRSLFLKRDDLVLMLTAYFDDSGTSPSNQVAVVAGYLGSVAQWERFNTRWAVLLRKYHVKALHRADLESFQKEFYGWTPERKTEFLKKAHAIIRACTYTAIGANLIKADLAEILGDSAEKIGGAYGWCAHTCLVAISQWCDAKRYNQPIQFVFEAGTEGQGQIDRMFRFLSRNDYFRRLCRVGGWSFQNKSVMPLQAADTAAYEFYKLIHGHVIERGIRGVRKSARDLFRQQELQYLRDWDRPNLERWAKEWLEQFRLAEVS